MSAPAPITVHQELDWIPGDNSWFFNGTATAEINLGSTNYSFERSDDFSLSIWYQQDVPLQTGIIGKKNSSNRGYTVFITATGEIRFQLVNTFPTNELQVSTPASFNDASLHNVLITYNGSSVPSGVVIYVDGVSQVLTTINNSLIATIINTEQFKIGRDGQSGASGFTGILAHASVWDRVLTAPEAAEVYNSGEFPDLLTTSAASSLIGWWKLNELDFTGVNGIIDYSSSNIDGTANTGAIKGASPVGTLIVRNTNTWGRIVPRTAGQVLTSNGLNSIPSFQNVSGVGVFDANASYVVLGVTGSLNNERALTAGTGITLTDAGAGSTVTAAINNNVVATISGSRFTGNIVATQGISGSLQQLSNGNSYLVAGSGVIITSGSGPTGQVTISATGGGSGSGADADVSYVVMAVTASLPNERALAAGTGITRTDGGAGGNVTLAINDGIVATISGSRFTGNVLTAAGLSGSLQQTSAGTSYLVAGENILIASGSGPNGQITISAPASGGSGNGADFNASFVVINTTSSLPNERSLAAGSGITILDNGPGSTVTISASGSLAISSSFAEFIPNQTTSTFIRWQFDSSTFVGNNIYTNTGVSSSLLLAMTASSPVRIVPNSPGVFRQSVGFSHGYMVAPERFANIAGNQISISTWIRPVTTGSGFKAIIAKQIISGSWTTPFAPVSIYQLNTDNALVEFAVTTAGTRTVATADTNTALKLRPEQWNNVTMVYNGVNIKGYVNAVQVANTAKTGLLDYGTNGLWFIAGNPVTNDEFYSGSIDDIRIENTAWTPEQVREQYETGIFNTYVSGSRSLISSLSGFFA